MAEIKLDYEALAEVNHFDLSKAARNKRGRRNVARAIDRLYSLFHGDLVVPSLKFAVFHSGDGRALIPVLQFEWTRDMGGMIFPQQRTIYVPATDTFVPPHTNVGALTDEQLIELGLEFLRSHNLKLVASDPVPSVLRLECRIRKKASTTAASMTFQTNQQWLNEQYAVLRAT